MKRSVSLHRIATAVIALGLQACCRNVPEYTNTWDFDDIIDGSRLSQIRQENDGDEDRCAAACEELAMSEETGGTDLESVESCSAVGDVEVDNPWSEANAEVTVTCTGTTTETGFCTGRRPQGHREATDDVHSSGTWFAAHAHLEAASVTAFVELALWLERHQAPTSLATRCRAAARDETRHAKIMHRLARARGARVEPCESEAPSEDLLKVALHNAVEGCVHEAFAASVAAVQARRAHASSLRSTFAAIADDELRHGQLAWDLHAWFLDQLDDADRVQVTKAQHRALAELGATASHNAGRTPAELGWPTPAAARAMAQAFAQQAMAA